MTEVFCTLIWLIQELFLVFAIWRLIWERDASLRYTLGRNVSIIQHNTEPKKHHVRSDRTNQFWDHNERKVEPCLPKSHLFHPNSLCKLLAASAGLNSQWSLHCAFLRKHRCEDKTHDPVPIILFSSSSAFAKTPYLRKPFLVVHIHLNNYSDRYTLLQEQAYRILTRIHRSHEARDYLPLCHRLLRPSICISLAIYCRCISSANCHDSLNPWKWNVLRTSPITWCVLRLLPANNIPPAR